MKLRILFILMAFMTGEAYSRAISKKGERNSEKKPGIPIFLEQADIVSYPKEGELFSRDKNDVAVIDGDIKITAEQEKIISRRWEQRGDSKAVTDDISRYWPRTNIPYEDALVDSIARSNIQLANDDLKAYTCVRLVRRTTQNSYINFISDSGCYSYIGKVGGAQPISLQSGTSCTRKGSILHEIMHALGFWHEQSRADRDNYVTINTASIQQGKSHNFDIQSTISFGSPYDFYSVLHYPLWAFTKDGSDTIIPKVPVDEDRVGQRVGMAQSDIDQINQLYCSTFTPNPITTVITPTTTPSCVDLISLRRCNRHKNRGNCTKKRVRNKCRKTCGVC